MLNRLAAKLTYANVMVTLLAVLVIGGGSAVAIKGANRVFSEDIVNSEVKQQDIRKNAVTAGKVRSNSLRGSDIKEGSLDGVGMGILGGAWYELTGQPEERQPIGSSSQPDDFGYLAPADFVARDLRVEVNDYGPTVPAGATLEIFLNLEGGQRTPLDCTITAPNQFGCDSGDATASIQAGEFYDFRIVPSAPQFAGTDVQFGWRAVSD